MRKGAAFRGPSFFRDGEPWFVAADVAEVLGYVDTDQAVRNHCKAAKILKPVESTGMKIPNRGMTIQTATQGVGTADTLSIERRCSTGGKVPQE